MTIRKGVEWGTAASRPPGLVSASTDAELAGLVARDPNGAFGVTGGDLFHSLGAPAGRETMQHLPLDALQVRIDDDDVLAVAHVVARRGWYRGPLLAVMNCGYIGDWNVAPRAHPNDGRMDVVEVNRSMSIRQRLAARRRVPAGTHVPHPDIAVRAIDSADWRFDRPTTVYVDGSRRGECTTLSVTLSPDHFSIYI